MKLLLFSDLHRDVKAAASIVDRSQDVDVIVGAGDFASARHGIDDCIRVLRAIEKRVVLVAGNNESTDELRAVCRGWPSAHVMHGSGVTIGGVEFWGLAGGVPVTPFGAWSYDFSEEEASQLLAGCPIGAVLVSHSPPKGAADVTSAGASVGSTAVRDTILAKRPILVVCGHIHDSWGKQERLGETLVINAGPKGVVWSTES